jgi:hypothetical protein
MGLVYLYTFFIFKTYQNHTKNLSLPMDFKKLDEKIHEPKV